MRDLRKDEIQVKVKQITEKGCLLLLYKTARVDAQILDEEFGVGNWVNDYKEIKGNLFCGIGVKIGDKDFAWRWDCGVESETEAEKGEASDAFKRAGFKWGIGVELYSSPFIWAKIPTEFNEKINKWKLVNPFTKFYVDEISIQDKKIVSLRIIDDKNNVVFTKLNEKDKKNVDGFKKDATSQRKAENKGKKVSFDKSPVERFDGALSYLNTLTPETIKSETTTRIDAINKLIDELRKVSEDEKANTLDTKLKHLLEIDDIEIKF